MINEERSSMTTSEQENIAKSVEYEILKIESLRSLILAIVIGLLTITFLIATYIYLTDIKYGDKLPIPRMIVELLLIGFSGFEFVIWYFINQYQDKEKSAPKTLRFLVAFVEISLPTLLIFIISHVVSIHALYLPPVFLYFIIIALSALSLNFTICIFTGVIAALEYILLAWYLINFTEMQGNFYNLPPISMFIVHLVKSLMILTTGVITGVITNKLKKVFLKSFQSISEKKTHHEHVWPTCFPSGYGKITAPKEFSRRGSSKCLYDVSGHPQLYYIFRKPHSARSCRLSQLPV